MPNTPRTSSRPTCFATGDAITSSKVDFSARRDVRVVADHVQQCPRAPEARFDVDDLSLSSLGAGFQLQEVLRLLLAGGLWWFDRWQAKRGKRPEARLPVHFGWLYALAFIACLTHPALDWLNVYGIRLLEPFSSRWFYGDVLFIVLRMVNVPQSSQRCSTEQISLFIGDRWLLSFQEGRPVVPGSAGGPAGPG